MRDLIILAYLVKYPIKFINILTTCGQCIVICTQTNEIRKRYKPYTQTKECSDIHKRFVVSCKVIKPQEMIDKNKNYSKIGFRLRNKVIMHIRNLPQLLRNGILVKLINGKFFKFKL